ncbi:MerR family transcriptional regulator [Lactobacillus melliventris]|uniref:MerR family transcriptional regulator n=1 Tax=Lactobacillus melliventris TaxID=1218507 RepID=UPI00165058B5|nr:MerR family transcriptional regulator [Lactobacillus melliventris]MBC6350317.1 MerR family transcriptional regulator [Lactobacillus melliventris]
MYLKEFVQKENTTPDTVRHYIYLKLLNPGRKGKNYWFTENETDTFEAIKEFQGLGFSLQEIKDIKKLHDESCSTEKQRKQNLKLIKDKIAVINAKNKQIKNAEKSAGRSRRNVAKKALLKLVKNNFYLSQ